MSCPTCTPVVTTDPLGNYLGTACRECGQRLEREVELCAECGLPDCTTETEIVPAAPKKTRSRKA